jgi:hypothetical protein
MNQAQFYQQPASAQVAPPQPAQVVQPDAQNPGGKYNSQEQFMNQPLTGADIVQQFQRIKGGFKSPTLDPGQRVVSPNAELVQPSNFKTYYERLSAIQEANQNLLGAAQARSAFKRAQELKAAQDAAVSSIGKSGSSGGGQAFGGGVPSNPAANFRFAQNIAGNYGWGANELSAWYTLGMKESGWRNTAQNPTSTAYGIGQFLNSTWAGVGIGKTSDPATQVEAMARYIKNRYGSPSRALAFHLSHNWY